MRAMEYTPHPPAPDLSRPPVKDGAYDWDEWRQLRDDDNREFRYRMTKRMSDAECAAEYWQAVAAHWFTVLDPVGDPELAIEAAWSEVETWHRFASYPHASEDDE